MTWEGLSPPYSTIVADPPWPYRTSTGAGAVITHDPAWRGVEDMGFTPMPMAGLEVLRVADLAADNAHLYLWTTNAFMVEAHKLAHAWGFEPKTILTWTKMLSEGRDKGMPRVSAGVGYWFRGATEHAIFAVRGSLRLQTDEVLPTGYLWRRMYQHSEKPPAFFDLVEKASPGPYVELFARQPRLGWDHWGYGYEVVGPADPPPVDLEPDPSLWCLDTGRAVNQ